MDAFVLAAGIVTSGLSLGAGIWRSLKSSHQDQNVGFRARPLVRDGAILIDADNFVSAVDVVVVNGKTTPLTSRQRDAVLQALGGEQPSRS